MSYIDQLVQVAGNDVAQVKEKDAAYGGSWKKRGGVGAYMMLARKMDRLDQSVQKFGWDVFKAIEEDQREESILDDIRDLRRYLLLVEAEIAARRQVDTGVTSAWNPPVSYPSQTVTAASVPVTLTGPEELTTFGEPGGYKPNLGDA